MSPTYFAVRRADIDRRMTTTRLAGDVTLMQALLQEDMSLLRSMYGCLADA
jgi:hypothetical protein